MNQTFESLMGILEDYFEKPLSELPPKQKERYERDFFPPIWDELTPQQRKYVVAQWDSQHDPATLDAREQDFHIGFADAVADRMILTAIELQDLKYKINQEKKKLSRRTKKSAQAPRKVDDVVLTKMWMELTKKGIPIHNRVSIMQSRLREQSTLITQKQIRERLYRLGLKPRRKIKKKRNSVR